MDLPYYIVGSCDLITIHPPFSIYERYFNESHIIINKTDYIELENNGIKINIRKVEEKYLLENLLLRMMRAIHYKLFEKEIKKIGYSVDYNGLYRNNKHINFDTLFLQHPRVMVKFKKYL